VVFDRRANTMQLQCPARPRQQSTAAEQLVESGRQREVQHVHYCVRIEYTKAAGAVTATAAMEWHPEQQVLVSCVVQHSLGDRCLWEAPAA
jgi:hypothetical protein